MKIRSHHLKYAAARSFWIVPVFALIPLLGVLTRRDFDLIRLAWVAGIAVVATVGAFLYYLRQSQRILPMTQKRRPRPKHKQRLLPKPED